VLAYHAYLDYSLARVFAGDTATSISRDAPATVVLEQLDSWQIPGATRLMFLYLCIFILAESAFIMMALKEYLQDLVKLTEMDLITGSRP
jgi:hypothetical protein